MAFKIALLATALLVQSISGQCINNIGVGGLYRGFGGLGSCGCGGIGTGLIGGVLGGCGCGPIAPTLIEKCGCGGIGTGVVLGGCGCGAIAPTLIEKCGCGGINTGIVGCGCGGSIISEGLLGNVATVANGGNFAVSSATPIAPSGIAVSAEVALLSELLVSGALPFVSSLSFESAVPTIGVGTVAYGAGDGVVGIEGITEGLGGFGFNGFGCGCGCGVTPVVETVNFGGLGCGCGLGGLSCGCGGFNGVPIIAGFGNGCIC